MEEVQDFRKEGGGKSILTQMSRFVREGTGMVNKDGKTEGAKNCNPESSMLEAYTTRKEELLGK